MATRFSYVIMMEKFGMWFLTLAQGVMEDGPLILTLELLEDAVAVGPFLFLA